jgi:MFS family permease
MEPVLISRWSEDLGANRVVVALSVARMADALGNSVLTVAIPLYVGQLPSILLGNLPQTVLVGILISFYGFLFSGLQPFSGALSDRLNRRKPFIMGGLVLMCVATLGFVWASRYFDLLLLRMLQGVGVAFTVPAALGLMAHVTQRKNRGGSMGIYTSLRMVGFAGGPLLGGYLLVNYGFSQVFIVGAIFLALAIVLVQILVKEPAPSPTAAPPRPFHLFDREVFTGSLIALGLAMFIMSSSFSMITTLEAQFNARLGQTALGFGIAFSALTFARLLFQLPLGRLSDRIGRKGLIVGGLILLAPVTAMLGTAATTLQLTGLTAIQGLASAAIAAPGFALAGDLSKDGEESQQMGLMAMGFGLGIALGPLIAGLLAVYSFELPFVVGAVMCLLAVWVVVRFVPETVVRGQPTAATQPWPGD